MLQAEHYPVQWRMGKRQDPKRRGRFLFSGQHVAVSTEGMLWSFVDLMTLLLIFFIMLYSDAARRPLRPAPRISSPRVETQAVAINIANDVSRRAVSERAVLPMDRGESLLPEIFDYEMTQNEKPHLNAPEADLNRQVMNTLADSISEDFYIRWENRQPVIVLGERITFDVGQAVLLPEAREALMRVAQLISQFNNCHS